MDGIEHMKLDVLSGQFSARMGLDRMTNFDCCLGLVTSLPHPVPYYDINSAIISFSCQV